MIGWIKLHRKIILTSFYKDSQTVHLAIHLLLKANHSDVKMIFNNEEVSIKRGSLITGRHALSRETGIHESAIYRKLRVLEKVGFLHINSNNKYSIITIINYDSYNCNEDQGEQRIEQPVNNQRTQTRLYKNGNNKYSRTFEERWQRYPVKDGKKAAERYFLATVKSEENLADFDKALENYLCHLKVESWKCPKNGKTFFMEWVDWVNWVEPETQKSSIMPL